MTDRAMNIAATGMRAQEKNVDTSANNLANSNTTGFKKSVAQFTDLGYQTAKSPGDGSPEGLQFGLGTDVLANSINFTPGESISSEGNPLSLQIQDNNGSAFFVINLPNGEQAYTRDGRFTLNKEGVIVTLEGNVVEPQTEIQANLKDNIMIDSNGNIKIKTIGEEDDAEPQIIGQIALATFVNKHGLEQSGGGLFKATGSSGDTILGVAGEGDFSNVSVKQFYLESSNSNSLNDITNLIKSQRAYGMNSKVIQTAERMGEDLARMKG
ncbi:MAG: flagellar basal-body rod protein FlgG [Candidatus Midichloriaceae bacterium]|jgi:flagellar basal-body rod protein FlgG